MIPPFVSRIPSHRLVQGVLIAVMVGIGVALCLSAKPWTFDFPEGKRTRVEDYAAVFSWWAGLVNLVPLAVLALTAKFWLRPLENIQHPTSNIPSGSYPWWVLPCLPVRG